MGVDHYATTIIGFKVKLDHLIVTSKQSCVLLCNCAKNEQEFLYCPQCGKQNHQYNQMTYIPGFILSSDHSPVECSISGSKIIDYNDIDECIGLNTYSNTYGILAVEDNKYHVVYVDDYIYICTYYVCVSEMDNCAMDEFITNMDNFNNLRTDLEKINLLDKGQSGIFTILSSSY